MDTILRVAFVYVFLMVGLRVLGKRELSKMSPFELVTLLLIPEIFNNALTRQDDSMTTAVVATTTIFVLVFATSAVSFRWKKVHDVIAGQPAVLVRHGKLVERNLGRERVQPDEIFVEMHRAGLERLEQVRWAILEDDGKIAIVPEKGSEVTAPDEADAPA